MPIPARPQHCLFFLKYLKMWDPHKLFSQLRKYKHLSTSLIFDFHKDKPQKMAETVIPSVDRTPPVARDTSIAQSKEQQIRQKKAKLYDLKNKLLKYQSFEGVPIEQLESLCENLNLESHPSSQKSIDVQQEKASLNPTQELHPPQIHQRQERQQLPALDRCCQNVYVIKLKQVLIILLVVICIIVKNNLPSGSTYDIGEFSIYETRYSKNMLLDEKAGEGGNEEKGLKMLNSLLGTDQQVGKIKLYLPKKLQKMKKKDQKELSYEKCIDHYNPICIDHRLNLYGSMNLQLEDWILDHLTGQERIIFESSVDFLLSIVLSAMKMKNLTLMGKTVNKISIIQSDSIGIIQLNSIKLSLIQNQCQAYVEIIKLERQPYRKISKYTHVFVSQQFYLYSIYPFGQNPAATYPNTSFILYMARGMNDTLKVLLKQVVQMHIVEVEFKMNDEKFYIERELDQKEMAFNDKHEKMRIIVVRHGKDNGDAGHKQTVVDSKEVSLQYNQEPSPSSAAQPLDTSTVLLQASQPQQSQLPINNPTPIKHTTPFSKLRLRNLAIQEHPCISQNSYEILPIMSFFDKHIYIQTIFNYKLLLPLEKANMYQQKGAISPELLFFISQNIKQEDVVFFAHQLYQDDLVLMVAARAASSQSNFHCVTPDVGHQVLNENLRMNGLKQFVTFDYFSITQEERTRKYYLQQNFNILFLTLSSFIRDYSQLSTGHQNRIIIFYWLFDVNFFEFMKDLTKKHKVWAILQRFQKISLLDSCINYGLSEVTQSSVLQVDRSWLIVQL